MYGLRRQRFCFHYIFFSEHLKSSKLHLMTALMKVNQAALSFMNGPIEASTAAALAAAAVSGGFACVIRFHDGI